MSYKSTGIPGKDELLFLPLGGAGEIGMNLNLYGHDGHWLMVDLGIGFADAYTPGIDILLPDPSFIEEQSDRLLGILVTHAHEDHIGAIAYLWEGLKCPVYVTRFAHGVLTEKLRQEGLLGQVPIHIIEPDQPIKIGPFKIDPIMVTHSIPEPQAFAIETSVGRIIHTGDWRLDLSQMKDGADSKKFKAIGDQGVLAMICDSTNVFETGFPGGEKEAFDGLVETIKGLKGRVVVSCFASNIMRLEAIVKAANKAGRQVALVGLSLGRMVNAAQKAGYLETLPPFLSDTIGMQMDRNKILFIATGSQGEPRAALPRIARGEHPAVKLSSGDNVLFSSRQIPGNETSIALVQNRLVRLGVRVITADDAPIHVSGHPGRQEMKTLYDWVRPHISIPVHGESRHLYAHSELAHECGVKHITVAENGTILRLSQKKGAEMIDQVHCGIIAVDDGDLISLDSPVIKERKKIMHMGAVHVTMIYNPNTWDQDGISPENIIISTLGIALDHETDLELIYHDIYYQVSQLISKNRDNDKALSELVKRFVRGGIKKINGKKPIVTAHIVRV